MMDILIQWATLLSPIISVIAIIVALCIARSSSKDAQKQIDAIHNLLDVFIAANNLDIVDAQRKYQSHLYEIDMQIESLKKSINIVNPFASRVVIDNIEEMEKKSEQKQCLERLLSKRNEIEVNLSLIQDYIKKSTKL